MIITKADDISDSLALDLVAQVVMDGKISHDSKGNEFYCWCSHFTTPEGNFAVYTRRNLNQPSFDVRRIKNV